MATRLLIITVKEGFNLKLVGRVIASSAPTGMVFVVVISILIIVS